MERLTIRRPDDWHLHVRDGEALAAVVPLSAAVFERAVIMPNTRPPIRTVDDALEYRRRIVGAVPEGTSFEPLMTLYLTDQTQTDEIGRANESGRIVAAKLYPAGATTNSDLGVTDIDAIFPVLDAMQTSGLLLLVHGEVVDDAVDIFDREKVFIDRVLEPLVRRFPALKIVLEHVTTRDGVQFVRAQGEHVAGTITPHHLLFNRNAMLVGGIKPHHYCLPVLKRELHREALVEAATSGEAKFFLGTDSAPHEKDTKECSCGCAGVFNAPVALPICAAVFEVEDRLDRLEAFVADNGARFYDLPGNARTLELVRDEWTVPTSFKYGNGSVVPLLAGGTLQWQVRGIVNES
jgi:dihydroorotase